MEDFMLLLIWRGGNILPANPDREINKKYREVLKKCIEKIF